METSQEKSNGVLNFKLIAVNAVIILIALSAVVIISTMSIIKTAEQFSIMQGMPVVEKVFKHIDGDKFEKLVYSLDKDAPWAEETRLWMLDVAQSVGCAYLFTMSPVSGSTYRYIIDGSCDPSDEENFSPMGTEEDIASWTEAPFITMKTGEMTSSGINYQESWGWTVSTYKAIKNSNGKSVGFIGCDFEVSFIINMVKKRVTIIISISLVIFAVFIIIILKLKSLMTQISRAQEKERKSMNQIREGMEQIRVTQEKEHRIGATLFEEAQNLAVSAKETAATSQDSAAAVKEIVATMEDTNDLSESISLKIKDVSGLANTTSSDVLDGVAQIELNVKQLHDIFDANQQTINGIKNLSEKIESIWDIVTLINNVADQAKIIAFNAELEASSAGEAGKSFRIVANEIRRLSDGIIIGTREIKEKISEIQHSSDNLLKASENSTKKINSGYENARGLDERFNSIKKSAEITAKSADDIADIIQQQATASEQILIAIKEIASGVESFTVATDNISGAAENVRKISEELNNAKQE